jgi:phage protein D
MAATPIPRLGEPFYVPHFEVKLAGERLPLDIVRDVIQVTYKDKVDEIDSFEMTLNNWDATAFTPKYEPASKSAYQGLFDPGKQIELTMGYQGNTKNDRQMMRGEITTLEPTYPESGALTLSVRGLNVLHKFRKKQHTFAWYGKKDSDIAVIIGNSPENDKKPGLGGLEVRIDEEAKQREDGPPFTFMNNRYDIVFLLERARRHGYSLFLGIDSETGKEYLNFKPAEALKAVTYELAWGTSLAEFKPTLTTARQVSQVTVRGWDRKAGKAIEGTFKLGDKGLTVNRDLDSVAQAVQGRQEVITDRPVSSEKEAKDIAMGILSKRTREMVKATGSTVGLPDLRAGCRVEIKNLGPRFSGTYFVTETTHTISEQGYRTSFSAEREQPTEGAGA